MSKYLRSRRVPLVKEEPKALDEELDLFLETVEASGTNLRALREKKGWSLQELADRVDVDEAHLAQMEQGDQPIPLRVAKRFSKIFRRPVHQFL